MASNNHQGGGANQPRRKRNKKPVKRYSEEYSNRPNPYTGYSSDGNYHPEAKTRPIEEASVVEPAEAVIDLSQVFVIPPAPPTPPPARSIGFDTTAPAASETPVVTAAPAAPETSVVTAAPAVPETSVDEEVSAAAAPSSKESEERPVPKSGSHRKKNADRARAKRDKAARVEAKKAAVDRIAKGVAAHSVSEQMIDDITSMSDVIEDMEKAEKSHEAQQEGVNWDEFYAAAFPPREKELKLPRHVKVKAAAAAPSDEASDQTNETNPMDQEDLPLLVKPVVLGEDEMLPFDKMAAEEARRKAEEQAQTEQSDHGDSEDSIPDISSADVFVNPPLEPSDLIPVLDFDKPVRPAEASDEAVLPTDAGAEMADAVDAAIDGILSEVDSGDAPKVTTASIEQILQAVEQEKLSAVQKAQTAAELGEFVLNSEAVFETERSENWHEITPPPVEETETDETAETAEAVEPTDQERFEDNAAALSEQLMQTYLALETEEQPAEDADETAAEETVVIVEPLPDETASGEQAAAVDVTTPDAAGEPADAVEIETPAGIDISDIENEIFAETAVETDMAAKTVSESEAEQSDAGGDAVKEKLEKLVEAAELAEMLRRESEDSLPKPMPDDRMGVQTGTEASAAAAGEPITVIAQDEVIREYHPRPKTGADSNVFESVLIIDDNSRMLDTASLPEQDDTLFLHTGQPAENPTAVFKLPDQAILLPTDYDDADFQEQWLDENEDGDNMATRSKKTRRRVSAFIGAVTILFALMILVSAVRTTISGINSIGSTGEKKAEYTIFISPVVLNDPAPFENVESADNQMLLESAIWSVLSDMGESLEYDYDATGKIVLPADRVEEAGRRLFGSDVKLNMDVLSESEGSAIYYYDSIDNSFHISTRGIVGPAANITKIAQKSDYVSLVVGYSSQAEMSLTSSDGDEVECYKYMEYVLALKPDGSYYIQSIRNYVED